jgi:hypothetical protein
MGSSGSIRRRSMIAAPLCFCCAVRANTSSADCLFSQGGGVVAAQGCTPDPLNLRGQPLIRSALSEIGAAGVELDLRGCQQAIFEITTPSPQNRPNLFRINYPVREAATAESYLAPITHELCHSFQIRSAGGISQLRHLLRGSSARIELGADFLTGIIYRRHTERLGIENPQRNLRQFQHSLDLLGSYRTDQGSHGEPVHRVNAFRHGFFMQDLHRGLWDMHSYFQSDIYGQIV